MTESKEASSTAPERGRTVHGEAANAGHRVLAPDDADAINFEGAAKTAELSQIASRMESTYGRGEYCRAITREIAEIVADVRRRYPDIGKDLIVYETIREMIGAIRISGNTVV